MITDRNLNLGFTAYDSIYEIKINTESKQLHKFNSNHRLILKSTTWLYIAYNTCDNIKSDQIQIQITPKSQSNLNSKSE